MIRTKYDLKSYIDADMSRYGSRPSFLHYYLFGDESGAVRRYIKRLRKTEYYYIILAKEPPGIISYFVFLSLSIVECS